MNILSRHTILTVLGNRADHTSTPQSGNKDKYFLQSLELLQATQPEAELAQSSTSLVPDAAADAESNSHPLRKTGESGFLTTSGVLQTY